MNKYRKFNTFLLSSFLLLMLSIGLLNFVSDPYGVNNLNSQAPLLNNNPRLFKAIQVTQLKPSTVFLGTSREDRSLDPTHPALANYQPAYNLGIPGASMYEVKRYFQHILINQPQLKQVVIGLDFFIMFNSKMPQTRPGFSESRLNKIGITLQDALEVTLSLDASKESLKRLYYQNKLTNLPYYLNNGMQVWKQPKNSSQIKDFEDKIKTYLIDYKNIGYDRSDNFFLDFKEIIDTCKKNNININIYISPLHASHWETARLTNLWQKFEEWKRELVEIAPVWDFSGYNSVTTEPISNNMKFYWESSHYRKIVGDLLLNRIFHYHEETVPSDFGTLMTSTNIESHLAKIRNQREIWVKNHPNDVSFVNNLKKHVEEKQIINTNNNEI